MKITEEEYRVYFAYDTMYGTYKNLPDKCYEILNEIRTTKHFNNRSSQSGHYYKIKW